VADEKGKPIAAELVASPSAHAPTAPDRVEACVACRQVHGSVGVALHCLGREVKRLRAIAGVMADVQRLRDDAAARLRRLDPDGMKDRGSRVAGYVEAYDRALALLARAGGKS
jgi:hypothetical protein